MHMTDMPPDSWEPLSTWHNAWLEADVAQRERLHREFVANHPELAADADALAAASATVGGFLDVPAILANVQALAEEDAPLPAGSQVGPYRIVALLARGGMGDVYRATDVRLRRDVALKVLSRSAAGDAERIERFVREARQNHARGSLDGTSAQRQCVGAGIAA